MKRLLTLATLFFVAALSVFADEQKIIKLDNVHIREQVNMPFCNVFVTWANVDEEGNAKVNIEIENLDESNVIIIFGHAFPEKELKKLSPSITFDKKYPGSKGHRNIDTYKQDQSVIFIEPSEKLALSEVSVRDAAPLICRLPLYIAKYKDKKILVARTGRKLLLMEKQILELEIEVDQKPDEDFVSLEKEANDLIKRISKQSFCTNKKHSPSLSKQEAPYKDKINRIKSDVDKIISRNNWQTSSWKYVKYNEIKQKLDAIDFSDYERDCGKKHGKPEPVGCKYCKLTPQQIYHKLDDYYKKIYSSNNRKATKDAVMSDVNLLYSCGKHSPAWKSSNYNSKITERYNRINKF